MSARTWRHRFENVFQIITAALAHLFVSKEGIPELPYTTMLDRYVLAGLLVTFGQLFEAVIVYDSEIDVIRHYDELFVRVVGPLWAALNVYYLVLFSLFTHYGSSVVNENVGRPHLSPSNDQTKFSSWLKAKLGLSSAHAGGTSSGHGDTSTSMIAPQLSMAPTSRQQSTEMDSARLMGKRWRAAARAASAEATEADPEDPLLTTVAVAHPPAAAASVEPTLSALSPVAETRPYAQPPADAFGVTSRPRSAGVRHSPDTPQLEDMVATTDV